MSSHQANDAIENGQEVFFELRKNARQQRSVGVRLGIFALERYPPDKRHIHLFSVIGDERVGTVGPVDHNARWDLAFQGQSNRKFEIVEAKKVSARSPERQHPSQ